MVYFAAGISGLTAIVGTFFVKDYLGLSAAFLAGLAFWAGIPWALKMPVGHLVDIFWRWKGWLVYLGAALIAASLSIMYGLVTQTEAMEQWARVETWYVLSVLLAPGGYVIQDAVADAMTVEAVPNHDDAGAPLPDSDVRSMHTTMQTLGRLAIIGGTVAVAALNITMFSGVESMTAEEKLTVYGRIYLSALLIPLLSISGVALGSWFTARQLSQLQHAGKSRQDALAIIHPSAETTEPNWWILGGSLIFVLFTIATGLSDLAYAQEIIFIGSMAIVLFLLHRLLGALAPELRAPLIGTAVIIFIYRATPLPGAGMSWFEIDVLGFDQQFLSVLSLITSLLAIAGMIALRPLMATRSIAYIVVILTLASGLFALPNIGLYYGLHEWTAAWSDNIVDARFIAIMDTALESPLGQIAMIPMLAWIAKNAPPSLKATFFAVMASFTNLALSASSLLTKYLNRTFVVSREVTDRDTGQVTTPADYSDLGILLITVAVIAVAAPLLTVLIVQMTRFRTQQ